MANDGNYSFDGVKLNGYWHISLDDEEDIWIDCPIEYISTIVDALNDKAIGVLRKIRADTECPAGIAKDIDDYLIQLSGDRSHLIKTYG